MQHKQHRAAQAKWNNNNKSASGFRMKTAQLGVKIKQRQTNRPVNDLHQTGKLYPQPIKRWSNKQSTVCRTASFFFSFFATESVPQCHWDGGDLATYHTKSLQTEQKVGWLKKMAVNSWFLTTWTLGCLMAPLLLFSVVTPSSGITFTDSLLGTVGRKAVKVHKLREKGVFFRQLQRSLLLKFALNW